MKRKREDKGEDTLPENKKRKIDKNVPKGKEPLDYYSTLLEGERFLCYYFENERDIYDYTKRT